MNRLMRSNFNTQWYLGVVDSINRHNLGGKAKNVNLDNSKTRQNLERKMFSLAKYLLNTLIEHGDFICARLAYTQPRPSIPRCSLESYARMAFLWVDLPRSLAEN